MKIYSTRLLRCLLFAVLLCCVSVLVVSSAEPVGTQTLASLPYHDESKAAANSVGLFEIESGFYIGEMVCTDNDGNIYIYDPLSEVKSELKKFDRQGQLLWSWPLETGGANKISAVVASNGYVWLTLKQSSYAAENSKAFPLVILQPGSKTPLVDWRQQMPQEIERVLYSSVTSEQWDNMTSQGKQETRTWNVRSFAPSDDKVTLLVSNEGGKNLGYRVGNGIVSSPKIRWQLVLSNDGKQLLQAKEVENINARYTVSNDGAWRSEFDSADRPRNWTELWLWKDGQAKGEPLVTRAELQQPTQSWQRLVGTQTQSPPRVSVDAKGNIYLSWRRKSNGPNRRFTVGKTSWLRDPMGEDYGQRALVVLDSNGKFVTSVPWTTCYYEWDDWVIPAPDGSGFYRQEFGEKSLNIHWYPLPNFKASAKASSKPTTSQPTKP